MKKWSFLLVIAFCLIHLMGKAQVDANYFNDVKWRMIGPHRGGRTVGAFASPLKLTVAGYRYINNVWTNGNQMGRYWSSTVVIGGTTALSLEFINNSAISNKAIRSTGRSVRCIKN